MPPTGAGGIFDAISSRTCRLLWQHFICVMAVGVWTGAMLGTVDSTELYVFKDVLYVRAFFLVAFSCEENFLRPGFPRPPLTCTLIKCILEWYSLSFL